MKLTKLEQMGNIATSVIFPYSINQFHSVPNCLCVTEVKLPWWGESSPLLQRPGPGEGEYDFPFYDLNIVEDDVIDLDKLMEVLELGKEQLATRGDRKFGRKPYWENTRPKKSSARSGLISVLTEKGQ